MAESKKKKPAPAKKPAPKKKPAAAKKPRKSAGPAAAAEAEALEVEIVEAVVEPADDAELEAAELAEGGAAPIEDAELVAAEEAPEPLTEEEKSLSELYGDDLAAPATAHAEFRDHRSKDEDRPMMPEINARDERKHRWEERRESRRRRRDERGQRREGGGGGGGGGGGAQQAQHGGGQQHGGQQHAGGQRPPAQQRLPMGDGAGSNGHAPAVAHVATTAANGHDALARVGTPLGDAAATVFAQLRNGQPLPVRQLAAMMRKRALVERDPDQLAAQLKAELLGDERSYRTLGLRPRIVYRGRDLFAPGPVAMSVTAEAEAGVATALSRLAGATHRALAHRVVRASPAGFERLIHAYLVAAGYRDIEWIKRVGEIAYATATAPGLARTVLISARSGDTPIDRRGIGELRVGVEAKDFVSGILFAARELSEDAERELERAGRSIAVICGDQLVAALIASGVGVVSSAAPVHYVDDQLLDELLAG
jgi:restriction endonuclease Mrr|nr:restriction endonuclease [Kofleriaceae bacterium]